MDGGRSDPARIVVPVVAVAVAAVVVLAALLWPAQPDRETLYQASPFSTFSAGRYDGNTTFSQLAGYGDFGIGTLNGLDGEMYALDGKFYQIPVDGVPREIQPGEMTPYATVTFFDKDLSFQVADVGNYSQLRAEIDQVLPDHDSIYAIKVTGAYAVAETRSVPKQDEPYQPLSVALQGQVVFKLSGVEGVAVGFYFPESMDGVDAVGYHFHFLTDDRTAGGHLLDCGIISAVIELDRMNEYHLLLS